MHDVNVPQYKIHKKLGDYLHEPVVVGPEGGVADGQPGTYSLYLQPGWKPFLGKKKGKETCDLHKKDTIFIIKLQKNLNDTMKV
jgi:hypothetical protein